MPVTVLKRVIQVGYEKVRKCVIQQSLAEIAVNEKKRRTLSNLGKRNQLGCLIEAILDPVTGKKDVTLTDKFNKLAKPDIIEGF